MSVIKGAEMPYYDLYCQQCEKEYVVEATIKEKAAKKISCPECGSRDMQTLFKAPPAFIKKAAECPNRQSCGVTGCRHAG